MSQTSRKLLALLCGCTIGVLVGLPLLALMRDTWFPKKNKVIRGSSTVGGIFRGLVREESPASSTSSLTSRASSVSPMKSVLDRQESVGSTENQSRIFNPKPSVKLEVNGPRSLREKDWRLFNWLISEKSLIMEECSIEEEQIIKGSIAVNDKENVEDVFVRYSSDGWKTFTDTSAHYVSSILGTGGTINFNQFEFKLPFEFDIKSEAEVVSDWSCEIDFAICYRKDGKEMWDNNEGKNHHLHLSTTIVQAKLRKPDIVANSFEL